MAGIYKALKKIIKVFKMADDTHRYNLPDSPGNKPGPSDNHHWKR